jgi:hypothetical protein
MVLFLCVGIKAQITSGRREGMVKRTIIYGYGGVCSVVTHVLMELGVNEVIFRIRRER